MTTPGAQSTLNFTRVPVEAAATSRERTAADSSRGIVAEVGGDGITSSRMRASTAVEEPVETVQPATAVPEEHAPVSAAEPPAQELVPDVPFDEYVQNFHYEPPSESAEVTMRGDVPSAEQRVAADKAVVADYTADANEQAAIAEPAPTEGEVDGVGAVASDSSVESRLGLEQESPVEAAAERPRFLDVGESSAETKAASSGTSTIVGPSFLGLSDAPEVDADYPPAEDFEGAPPRKSHWRAWLAAAVVIIFAGLGWMEWRAQSNQTYNGPVEVIKAKVRSLKNGGQPQLADQPAEDANAKPDMEVQEQPKPQQPTQAANPAQNPSATSNVPANNSAAASPSATQPATNTVTPPASTTAPPKQVQSAAATPPKPPAGIPGPAKSAQNSSAVSSSKSQSTTEAAATKPKPGRQDQGNSDDTAAPKSGAGGDELNKAKNASDSAAEAAWLWKSTAKGNPDAPVMLADMYMKGDGVPRSCEQAVVLLKTAAEKENARARNRLASMYATGNCVQRNRVEAYRWLSSALVANPHSDWAQQNKDLIWQQMTPEEQAQAQRYR